MKKLTKEEQEAKVLRVFSAITNPVWEAYRETVDLATETCQETVDLAKKVRDEKVALAEKVRDAILDSAMEARDAIWDPAMKTCQTKLKEIDEQEEK